MESCTSGVDISTVGFMKTSISHYKESVGLKRDLERHSYIFGGEDGNI